MRFLVPRARGSGLIRYCGFTIPYVVRLSIRVRPMLLSFRLLLLFFFETGKVQCLPWMLRVLILGENSTFRT